MPPRRRRQQEREHLNERRRQESDVKFRRFVRPAGLHAAIVATGPTGLEFPVSSSGQTVQPGVLLPTGSNTGEQGEFLLNTPPPNGYASAPAVAREIVIPAPVTAVLTITNLVEETWTNLADTRQIDLEGTGLNRFMQLEIFNESTPGFFEIIPGSLQSPNHLEASFLVRPDALGSESGGLRVTSGEVVIEFEDAFFSEIV